MRAHAMACKRMRWMRIKEKERKEIERENNAHTHEELVSLYGKDTVEIYLKKADSYHHTGDAALQKAEIWILEDMKSGKLKTPMSQKVKDYFSDVVM